MDNDDEEHTRLRNPQAQNHHPDNHPGILSPSNLLLQGTAAPVAAPSQSANDRQ